MISENTVSLGHSMSSDPSKLKGFSSDLHQNSQFHNGKDLALQSSTMLKFQKLDLYFQN